jgi:hypothetical protein
MKIKSFCWAAIIVCFISTGRLTSLSAGDSNIPTNKIVEPGWSPTHVTYISDSNEPEPTYEGLPVSQWIKAKTAINTNQLVLADLLTLKQVPSTDGWGIVNFELPINFDRRGDLHLGVINKDGDFVECCFEECERATNGNCLLSWNINFDPPGKHRLRAKLDCYNHFDQITVIGPPLYFYSSNACQFFESGSMYDSKSAFLTAKLREQTATYKIELKTTKGKHIRTITGSATNGLIDLEWDLKDELGKKFTEKTFDGYFYVKYPGESRSGSPAIKEFTKFDN